MENCYHLLIEVPLPCYFLIVSMGKGDEVEFKLFHHLWTCSYETKFSSPDKEFKCINNNHFII
jgi:hypothetical protein